MKGFDCEREQASSLKPDKILKDSPLGAKTIISIGNKIIRAEVSFVSFANNLWILKNKN